MNSPTVSAREVALEVYLSIGEREVSQGHFGMATWYYLMAAQSAIEAKWDSQIRSALDGLLVCFKRTAKASQWEKDMVLGFEPAISGELRTVYNQVKNEVQKLPSG
jgi:hypothetical protein